MNNEIIMRKKQMLEALDFIDDDLIAGTLRKIKPETFANTSEPPKMTWRTPFKHWRQFVALAACILLLSMASPLVSYIAEVIRDFNAGAGSGTTEEVSDNESKELYELFPDYVPAPLSEERIAELSKILPALGSEDEWTQYLWRKQYLGDFNGCYCYYSPGHLDWAQTEIVAGYEFTYSSAFTLHAVYNGEKMYLSEAYDRGYLTRDEIGMMAAYHERVRRNIVTLTPPETTTPLYNLFPDYVPEPLDSSKKEAIEALMGGGDTSWYHENRKNFYGIKYLGTFGECIVLSRRGEDRLKPRNIAGYDFYVADGGDVVVYFDNKIIDLEDAYNSGLISKENIGFAACLHDRLRRGSYYEKDWILETNN